MNRVFVLISYLLLGVILTIAGILTPAYWGVVPRDVLSSESEKSDSLDSRLEYYFQSENPGVVSTIINNPELTSTNYGNFKIRIDKLLEDRPLFQLSGGAEPYFERVFDRVFTRQQFQEAFSNILDESGIVTNTMSLFLNKSLRLRLIDIMDQSNNGVVNSILKARGISHFKKLEPVTTASGSPLDISVLITAMIVQSGYCDQSISQVLQLWSKAALDGPNKETEQLEIFLLSILNLSSKLGYMSMAELVKQCKSPEAIVRASKISVSAPDIFPVYYAVSLIHGDPLKVASVMYTPDDKKNQARKDSLIKALWLGKNAVDYILDTKKEITDKNSLLPSLPKSIAIVGKAAGLELLAIQNPHLGFVLKIILFWGGSLCLVNFSIASFNHFILSTGEEKPSARPSTDRSLELMRNISVALIIGGLFWFLSEPPLEKVTPDSKYSMVSTNTPAPSKQFTFSSSSSMNTQLLDQPTIIVLVAFSLIQFILYLVCRMKLAEIRKSKESASLKLELLANEENLFDSGLYVGLGGTVLALSMVTLGLVNASLMAAYASTLFGIISVAFVKIFHLRPLRQELIRDANKK